MAISVQHKFFREVVAYCVDIDLTLPRKGSWTSDESL